jgi:hypothetical protein
MNARSLSPKLAALSCGLSILLSAALSHGGGNGFYPAGDLTVTVEELEYGGVRVSLAGSATVQGYPNNSEEVQENGATITRTNFAVSPLTPPAGPGATKSPLPPGLSLTIVDSGDFSEPEPAQSPSLFLPVSEVTLPITEVVFPKGNWCLGTFETPTPSGGSTITGSGSVTADNIPFSYFIPGTYLVGPPNEATSEEPQAAEPVPASGRDYYYITYRVIPFTPSPSIRLSTPTRFPKTRLRRSAPEQEIRVTNTGNVKLTQISLAITGAASEEFSIPRPPLGVLEAGQSTKVSVGFRPVRRGLRRAFLTAQGTTLPRQLTSLSSEEESTVENDVEEPRLSEPVTVSDTVELEGTGQPKKRKPKPLPEPNSPRFPRGLYGNN